MLSIGRYKYLISNSIHIIIVFITTALMVVLCLSNFFKAFSMADDPADLLTNSYEEFSILSDENSYKIDNINDFIYLITNKTDSFMLLKENIMTKGKSIYFSNVEFKPILKEGRSFNEDDFKNRTNTILISSDIENNVIKRDGKSYYTVENNNYEVIGIYEKSSNKVNIDADYYSNMLAEFNLGNSSGNIDGLYQLDAFNNTDKILNLLSSVLPLKIYESEAVNSFSKKIEKTVSTQAISVFPIFLIIVMVLLNTIGITTNWIEKRKKEIAIRRLCGATKFDIRKMLFLEYILLTIMCFFIGLILAYSISKISLWIFIGFDFSIITVLLAFFFTLIIGLCSSLLLMKSYDKNEVNGLMR